MSRAANLSRNISRLLEARKVSFKTCVTKHISGTDYESLGFEYDKKNSKFYAGETESAIIVLAKFYDIESSSGSDIYGKMNGLKVEHIIDDIKALSDRILTECTSFNTVGNSIISTGFIEQYLTEIKAEPSYGNIAYVTINITGSHIQSDDLFSEYPDIKSGSIFCYTGGFNKPYYKFYQVVRREKNIIFSKEIRNKNNNSYINISELSNFVSDEVYRSTLSTDKNGIYAYIDKHYCQPFKI